MEMYEVGGCVRDEILGLPSKDIDFVVVLEPNDYYKVGLMTHFEVMANRLREMGFKIFLETPEYLTVRAQFPVGTGDFAISNLAGGPAKPGRKRLTADFVLARKESDYTDGRRPDKVEPGTLMDDLRRRDFTMNAIAKGADGNLIDPFNGVADIDAGIIRAVGDPFERLTEDALRAVRALRFSVTKAVYRQNGMVIPFVIENRLRFVMQSEVVLDAITNKISGERIKDEVSKMFHHDTMATLMAFNQFPALTAAMFSGSVHLDATLKQKGFK